MEKLEIVIADLSNPKHAEAIILITGQYALDPMGLKRRPEKKFVIKSH